MHKRRILLDSNLEKKENFHIRKLRKNIDIALTLYSEINYIYRATTAILAWFKNFLRMYVILHIFSFIPFNLLRRTICRVCKICYPISSDPAIVRKVLNHANLNQFACSKTSNDRQLKKTTTKVSICWEYVDDVCRRIHWRKLRVL